MQSNKQAILDYIRNYPYRYPPSVPEICTGVGLSSSTVYYHLTALVKLGLVGVIGDSPAQNSVDIEQEKTRLIIILNDVGKKIIIGELEVEIEYLRKKIHATALEKGMLHADVLKISSSLNEMINKVYKLIP